MFGIYNMLLNIALGERERDQSILSRKKSFFYEKHLTSVIYGQLGSS